MKTTVEIVQELLDKRAISAEEAVVLLTKEKEYVYWPNYQWSPIPYNPYPYYTAQLQPLCDNISYNCDGVELVINQN